jgi:hypothetical protein
MATTHRPIKIWLALVFAFSTLNIVLRLREKFRIKAETLVVIQSRPMT